MKKAIHLFVLCFIGCSNNSQLEKIVNYPKVHISNKVFFFGSAIDSATTEVVAECDCCASEIIFEKDSSFIAAFYCVEENSYAKGTYSIANDTVALTFSPGDVLKTNFVSVEYDSVAYQSTSNFRLSTQPIPNFKLAIFSLNNKTVLSKEGEEREYGMEAKDQTRSSFLNALRRDSVLHYLKIE